MPGDDVPRLAIVTGCEEGLHHRKERLANLSASSPDRTESLLSTAALQLF
jgi:hypothetical protein